MADGTLTAADAEEIYKGLTQEERIDLLERLIRGDAVSDIEALTTDERIERLEKKAWGKTHKPKQSGCGGKKSCGCR